MNLVDKLLKADIKKADEFETGVFQSRRLAKILEAEDETVEVLYREVPSRIVSDVISYQIDKKGRFDYSRSFDAKLMMVVEGCVDPYLRSKELQEYFGVKNAKELAEKLFASEINELSDCISLISGVNPNEDNEEEIKN